MLVCLGYDAPIYNKPDAERAASKLVIFSTIETL
jgi:hypothetical protein